MQVPNWDSSSSWDFGSCEFTHLTRRRVFFVTSYIPLHHVSGLRCTQKAWRLQLVQASQRIKAGRLISELYFKGNLYKPCSNDVRDRHLLKEIWMTWTWGFNEGSYLQIHWEWRRANQTRGDFFSESSVGNSGYTNKERVINEIPVCPRTPGRELHLQGSDGIDVRMDSRYI